MVLDTLARLRSDEDWEQNFLMKYKCIEKLEKEPGKDSAEDKGVDQVVIIKEVESIGQEMCCKRLFVEDLMPQLYHYLVTVIFMDPLTLL